MVLPILGGILGAGLATQALAHGVAIPAYNRRQGNRMRGILEDLPDDASMDDQIQALAMGGILAPDQSADMFARFGFQDYSAQRDQGNALNQLTHQYNLMDRNAFNAFQREVSQGRLDAINTLVGSEAGTYGIGLSGDALTSALDFAKQSISGIESGGNYAAMGPVTDSGDRAYGKYQVMGANIPSWTEKHLGQAMTPEEFLSSPQAQEAVFEGEFGRNMQQHGFANAASIWHSGRPLNQISPDTNDGYISTVDYVKRATGGVANNLGVYQAQNARFTPELRTEVAQTESALQLGEDVLDFAANPAADRWRDPQALREMQSQFQTTYLPALQRLTQSGAMQQAELDLFQQWLGDPFRVRLTDQAIGKLRGVMNTLEADVNNKLKGAQVDYQVTRQGSGAPEPVKPAGRIVPNPGGEPQGPPVRTPSVYGDYNGTAQQRQMMQEGRGERGDRYDWLFQFLEDE